MSNIVKKKLTVEGMHCVSCAMNIDFDLEDIDGVRTVKTNYAKQESEIEFDEEKISVEELIKSIEITGYKAKPKKTN